MPTPNYTEAELYGKFSMQNFRSETIQTCF